MTCNRTIEEKEQQYQGNVGMTTTILTQDIHSKIQYENLYELKKKIVRMTSDVIKIE